MVRTINLHQSHRALCNDITLTVRVVRFLLDIANRNGLAYTYDEWFRELAISKKTVARGTRQAAEYLWEKLDKHDLIDWDTLAAEQADADRLNKMHMHYCHGIATAQSS